MDYCEKLFWECYQRTGQVERRAYLIEANGRHNVIKKSIMLELNPELTFHVSVENLGEKSGSRISKGLQGIQ